VERGSFRRDLFHRLAVLSLLIPPLRERPADIEFLAAAIQRSHRKRHGYPRHSLSPEAVEYLKARPWPGNIRELSHLLEAALILTGGEPLDVTALESVQTAGWGGECLGRGPNGSRESGEGKPSTTSGPGRGLSRYSFPGSPSEERVLIRGTLAACRGNKSRAAKELGMARNTLRTKMKEYRLELE
jgi:DNA-binding NtrC family response regulator